MRSLRVWQWVAGSAAGSALVAYWSILGVNAQLRLSSLWWLPFWWVWIIVAIAIIGGVLSVVLAVGERPQLAEESPESAVIAEAKTRLDPVARATDAVQIHEKRDPSGQVITNYRVLEEVYAHNSYAALRTDGRYWVYRDKGGTGSPRGWVVPDEDDGTFEARNSVDLHIGWFESVSDAMRGVLEKYPW